MKPTQNDAKKIAVLFGGRSSEHEISLRSSIFILNHIPLRYQIIPVGIHRDGRFFYLEGDLTSKNFKDVTTEHLKSIIDGHVPSLFPYAKVTKTAILPIPKNQLDGYINTQFDILNTKCDCFFPVIHGATGEDGCLQGVFDMAEMPYLGCDIRRQVLCIDKDLQKRLVQHAGIPIAKYLAFHIVEYQENPQKIFSRIQNEIGFPAFVKPNSSGSAVGANKINNETEMQLYLEQAFQFDTKIIVEEFLKGTEVECAYLGIEGHHKISTPGEIENENFYSYEEKYSQKSKARLFIPARLSKNRMTELQNLAQKVAVTLGLDAYARIDFWNIESQNRFLFNEVNTIPGMTSISMFPSLWDFDKVTAEQWIEENIRHALARDRFNKKLSKGYQV